MPAVASRPRVTNPRVRPRSGSGFYRPGLPLTRERRVSGFGRRIVRRLLLALPLIWGVVTVVFLLVELVPGRPFDALDPQAGGRQPATRLRSVLGADAPLATRYAGWLGAVAAGDLGDSWSLRRPVADLLGDGVGNTVLLTGLALLLQFACGTAAGVLAARRPGAWPDRAITATAGLLASVPSFWIGIVLVWLLSVQLGLLPPSQMHSIDAREYTLAERFLDTIRHLILPVLALALPAAAGVALYVRDEVRDVLDRVFIRAARARGLHEARLLWSHGLRPALLPVAQLIGLTLPGLISGSVVVETLFAWPGMGRMLHQAVLARDQPLILGCTVVGSLMVVLGSLVADLMSLALDPRLREPAS